VAKGILDGFLSNAEEVAGCLRLEVHHRAVGFEATIDLVKGAGVFGQFPQRPGEVAILQLKGGDAPGDEAGVLNSAVDALGDDLELLDQPAGGARESFGSLEGEMQGSEFLANAIVEIVPDAAVLALAHHHEFPLGFVAEDRGWHSGAEPQVAIDQQRQGRGVTSRSGFGVHDSCEIGFSWLSNNAEDRRWHNSKVMFDELLSRHGLSLERLRSFSAVADAGSIARVVDGDPARQSLISRQIRELEEFFGVELTRRKGKGLELTGAGLELARQIRFQFQGLSDFKRSVANQPLEYKFAAGNSVLEWLLIPALPGIEKRIDGIHVQMFDTRSRDIIQGLVDHRFDFGIVRKSAVVAPLKYAPIGQIGYALYEPAAWSSKSPKPEKLAVTEGSEFLKELSRAVETRKKPLVVTHFCTNFNQASQLVRLGIAAAILPTLAEKFLGDTAQRIELPWLKKYRRDIGVAWHERLLETRPKAREMLEALKKMTAS